jgi:hypothetical protein
VLVLPLGNCLGALGEKGLPADRALKKYINYINNLLRKATTTRQQEKSARWVGYHKIN